MSVTVIPAANVAIGRPSISTRAIAAITLGSALEFFEFSVFSFFATLIGRQFFPAQSELSQLLLALATFGLGFVMRPLGGLIIGAYADRVGRRPAMLLTLSLMAVGSTVLACAPTYAQIGLAAPLMIVAARLIQGFAIGGEVGASTAMLMEYADDHNRGFYGSWQFFSQGLSFLLGSVVSLALTTSLSTEALESWGWRIPFLVGLLILPLGVYIRRHLQETAEHATPGEAKTSALQLIFTRHRRVLVAGVLMTIGGTASSYIVLDYMTNYTVAVLKLPMSTGIGASCLGALVQIMLSLWAGKLSDRIGRRRTIALGSIPMLLLIYPAFVLMTHYPTLLTLLGVSLVCTFFLVLITGPSVVMLTELFPRAIRASGLSLVYCLGVSIFGGFAQFFATGLISLTGDNHAPAFYVMVCLCATLAGLSLVKETAGKPLD
ncbi:MFS transporter [Pseudomonas alkylphenolica]|uniref:MFS transporter n=1 Tax=Pseudomonas alkylphenolica TaxID=237609 RepID=UPI0018D7D1AC|nr:MFS transporter [Pseudomonas alkylphenolica]MBH3429746.1 MFS transporter [Pseudomonas alkylphenolica]